VTSPVFWDHLTLRRRLKMITVWAREETTLFSFKQKTKGGGRACAYLSKHYAMKGSAWIDPRFLDLGTSRRWAVSRPRYPPYRKLGGPQSRCERLGEEKNSWPFRDSNPLNVEPVALPTALPRPLNSKWTEMELSHLDNTPEGFASSKCKTYCYQSFIKDGFL
jgi:hypothetical protein